MKILNKKYWFFKKKISDVTKSIWEIEFKINKSRQMRESIRQDRDKMVEYVMQVETAIKGSENDPEAIERYTKELEGAKSNIGKYEGQMKMLDDQIVGIPANGEDPGENGLSDTVKGLLELRLMYREYIKSM